MKPSLILLAILLLASACVQPSPAVNALTTSVAATLAADVPPTAVPPSPTAQPAVISPLNAANLSVVASIGPIQVPRGLAYSPDGSLIATAGGNDSDFDLRLWSAAGGSLQQTLGGHTGIVWSVAFSPDGSLLASGSSDQTVKIWDLAAGSLLHSLDFPYQAVSLRFSPDGQTLAVGGGDGSSAIVWLVSTATWQTQQTLAEYWNIPDIAFSPNGQTLVAGGTSRNVRVWRTADGAQQAILSHTGQVSSIAISPNGATIATGLCEASNDSFQCQRGAVWLWDLATGRRLAQLSGFPDTITDVAYSPDGALLFAGSRYGTLIVYDASNNTPLFSGLAPDGIQALALAPDGRTLVTAGSAAVHLWQVP